MLTNVVAVQKARRPRFHDSHILRLEPRVHLQERQPFHPTAEDSHVLDALRCRQ